jgi:uncharacterized protein
MKIIYTAIFIPLLCFFTISCENKNQNVISNSPTTDTLSTKKQMNMKSYVSMFEIPANDITRAIDFYKSILGLNIEKMDIPEMEMGIFPYEDQMVNGIIIKGDGYKPSADGVTIYLDGGDNLQNILSKVEENKGKIMVPKTQHADGNGFFAIFLDSEGNKIGLNSPN